MLQTLLGDEFFKRFSCSECLIFSLFWSNFMIFKIQMYIRAQWCLDGENVRALEPWSSIFGWFMASPNHLSAVLQAEWLQCWGNFNTHTGTILISDQSISVMKTTDQYCTRFPTPMNSKYIHNENQNRWWLINVWKQQGKKYCIFYIIFSLVC